MKTLLLLKLTLAVTTVCASLFVSSAHLNAQRGNFDPAEMRQRMMDNYKEKLEITDDAEWKVISAKIETVVKAQSEARLNAGGMFGRGGRGADAAGGGNANGNAGGGGGGNRGRGGMFGGEPNPDAEALQKAIESKGSPDEIKSKLARLRDGLKDKQAKLEKAQDDLKKLLSAKQEATAVLMGLVK